LLQVRDGKVKPLSPGEAGYAIRLSGKTLLDVRPESEYKKVNVTSFSSANLLDPSAPFFLELMQCCDDYGFGSPCSRSV